MAVKLATWIILLVSAVVAGSGGIWFLGDLNANGWTTPAIAPPSWLFGPVWTVLYLMVATSGYFLVFARKHPMKGIALGLWALQMCLNTLWTPVFFGAFDLWGAFYIILLLWATIAAYVLVSFRIDRRASILFMPYWAWVSFATILNYAYIVVNPTT